MASFSLQILLLLGFISRLSLSPAAQMHSILSSNFLPVTKDTSTNQYLTQIYLGTPPRLVSLVVDLGSPFIWTDCDSGLPSATRSSVQCRSIDCLTANAVPCGHLSHPTSSPAACTLFPENSITGESTAGELVEDIASFHFSDGSTSSIDPLLFSCAPPFLIRGLAAGARGVLGLGKSRISLLPHIAKTPLLSRKFSVCLSGKNGIISFPGRETRVVGLYESLVYTPIVGSGPDYLINVTSIEIGGQKLPISHEGFSSPAKISTVAQYTLMGSEIYEAFVRDFVTASEWMNMTRVEPVAPFEVCFGGGRAMVPVVDVVLQSEMVRWKIHGHNSMVEVGDDDGVMCLGFLNGGLDLGASIVIGGHQLDDNLMEFDLGSSMMGFSSSLLMKGTSCSDISLHSARKPHESI